MEISGCYYWEIMIPSFIKLPEKSGYELFVNDRRTFVNLHQHIKSVFVNDYDNKIIKNETAPVIVLKDPTVEIGNGALFLTDPDTNEVMYVIDFSNKKRKEISTTLYSQVLVFFESNKEVNNLSLAQNAFNSFYKSYQIVSDNFFALPMEHLHSQTVVIREYFYTYGKDELSKNESERLSTPRAISLALKQWFQPYLNREGYNKTLDQNAHAKELTKYLKATKHNDFINETLLSAKRERHVYKNYKYALLECFFIVENVVYNYIEEKKIAKGISRNKLKEASNRVGISYLLNIELPILIDNYDDTAKNLISSLDKIRKIRNDVVHNGDSVSEEEAENAISATVEMLNYFNIQKI